MVVFVLKVLKCVGFLSPLKGSWFHKVCRKDVRIGGHLIDIAEPLIICWVV